MSGTPNSFTPLPNEISYGEDTSVDDFEEEECRVCRGPAEEGRPLFAPCKCSGSIGLTHQDCLTSWLAVTRGDGRCELCKTKFRFAPKYADNAPDRLPPHEVILGLCSRAGAKWLPLGFRVVAAVTLWLIVAPLITAYVYHGWIHKPSSIPTRWKLDLVPGDIVSGGVVAGVIIVSFLSLMSFADFLRLHRQQERGRRGEVDGRVNRRGAPNDATNDAVVEGDVDYTILNHLADRRIQVDNSQRRVRWMDEQTNVEQQNSGPLNEQEERRRALRRRVNAVEDFPGFFAHDEPNNDDRNNLNFVNQEVNRQPAINERPPVVNEGRQRVQDEAENERNDHLVAQMMRDFPMFEPQFEPLDPAIQGEQVDMEINVALDELLGLRGPVSALVRNLLWLLAFNTVYLGIFVFVPLSVGSFVYGFALNTTAVSGLVKNFPYLYSGNSSDPSLVTLLETLNEEGKARNATFLLPDLATVTLGYFSCAAAFLLTRITWNLSRSFTRQGEVDNSRNDNLGGDARNEQGDDMAVFGQAFTLTLEATTAIIKVGVLLFLKMFLLPLLLGIWLDASTLTLFGSTPLERVRFAGHDLFASILLHWVAGITFMLLVTVSVLQLREVVHPDLLAHVIRPQEPQPDLLGNLMQESVGTHSKRMFLSLAIYAALLSVHVSIPSYLLRVTNLGRYLPFFNLKLWHIVLPQLQVPLELLLFHLSVLALLEKYKNHIGEMQHHWLVFMCKKLKITDQMLPKNIDKFELVGTRPILRQDSTPAAIGGTMPSVDSGICDEVDWFWYDLIIRKKDVDDFISWNIHPIPVEQRRCHDSGETKRNGRKGLSIPQAHVRLPEPSSDWLKAAKFSPPHYPFLLPHLLPPSKGSYQLNLKETEDHCFVVQFWKEVTGELIARPPEGWDDLGVGGAIVQGRWAWGKERKSTIEEGVAHRKSFFSSSRKRAPWVEPVIKITVLLICSWIAVFSVCCGLLSIPLLIGRLLYRILRIPDRFVHDPFAFVVGNVFLFAFATIVRSLQPLESSDSLPIRIKRWILGFRVPPRRKAVCLFVAGLLWFVDAPIMFGILYELTIVKSSEWYLVGSPQSDVSTWSLAWLVGIIMLNSWAFLCYFQVFTLDFWMNLGVEEHQQGDDNRNVNRLARRPGDIPFPGDDNPDVDERRRRYRNWQGEEGRIGRFANVWRDVVVNWEWEKIDPVVLLNDCAVPVAIQLTTVVFWPVLTYWLCSGAIGKYYRQERGATSSLTWSWELGIDDEGLFRQMFFRALVALSFLSQLYTAFKKPIQSWFIAAHQAARDGRYLIGEVLMNYVAEDSS